MNSATTTTVATLQPWLTPDLDITDTTITCRDCGLDLIDTPTRLDDLTTVINDLDDLRTTHRLVDHHDDPLAD